MMTRNLTMPMTTPVPDSMIPGLMILDLAILDLVMTPLQASAVPPHPMAP